MIAGDGGVSVNTLGKAKPMIPTRCFVSQTLARKGYLVQNKTQYTYVNANTEQFCSRLVTCHGQGSNKDGFAETTANRPGAAIPTPDEDKEVAHEAFLHAFEMSRPEQCRIPGMQEFAAAILARERIPSQQYSDPLGHIFEEFDSDGNLVLSAAEVGHALRSRDVEITDEQVAMFIDACLESSDEEGMDHNDVRGVKRDEFRDLIVHMAAADFQSSRMMSLGNASCSLETDDDVQEALDAWRHNLLTSDTLGMTKSWSMSESSSDDG